MEENEIVEETQVVEDEIVEPVEETEVTETTEETQKKGVQARIDELTWKRREEERKRIEVEQEREYWKKIALDKKPAKPSGRPTQEQYETVEEYEDALFGWYDSKKSSEVTKTKQQEQIKKAVSEFNKKAVAIKEQYKDFDQVVETPVFTDSMRKVLFAIENGPMVAYHIAKNKDVATRLTELPPEVQAYEIGKLETKLVLAQQNKPTGAPEPITPVGATGISKKDPSKMSTEEWMAWDRANEIEKLKAKMGG